MLRIAAFGCLAMVLIACGSGGGSTASATPSTSASPSASPSSTPQPTLSAADRAQVAVLEKKPLKIPAPAADGACHQGPFARQIVPYASGAAELEVYGTGPVYGQGGPSTNAGPFVYFDVTYFTDPTIQGVALVRINDLSRKYAGRFVGPLAVGASMGADTIAGQPTPAFSELALPAENPPADASGPAPGWGIWHIRQGIDQRFTCAAIQIDTATTTQVILAH